MRLFVTNRQCYPHS